MLKLPYREPRSTKPTLRKNWPTKPGCPRSASAPTGFVTKAASPTRTARCRRSSFGSFLIGGDITGKFDLKEAVYQRFVAERQVLQQKGELRKVTTETLLDAANTYIDLLAADRRSHGTGSEKTARIIARTSPAIRLISATSGRGSGEDQSHPAQSRVVDFATTRTSGSLLGKTRVPAGTRSFSHYRGCRRSPGSARPDRSQQTSRGVGEPGIDDWPRNSGNGANAGADRRRGLCE